MNHKRIITIGISGALAVALGALGAHFLKNQMKAGIITAEQLDGFEKGVKYHMYHTIMLLVLVIWNSLKQNKYLEWAYAFFFWGIMFFSGSLYFLCTRNLFGAEWLKFLGPVTPIGGLLFIVGWLMIAFAGMNLAKEKDSNQ